MEIPCEFINITSINPLISKCEIKVCYVGEEPNRNRSIITKEVAKDMANTLPGSPIVGYFNEDSNDFESHNKSLSFKDGKLCFSSNTRPYGFVDLNARAWFQKYLDDGVEHEYLVTEGYLWTGQYPEIQDAYEEGRPQSMELDQDSLDAFWTKDVKGKPQFFIINEAIVSKLCILGDDVEPCFEGSTVAPIQFSLEDDFKDRLLSMMKTMQEILQNEGGAPVFENYTVEQGSTLYEAMKEYAKDATIFGFYTEGDQKFAILQNDSNYSRVNFEFSDDALTVGETSEIAVDGLEAQYELVVEEPEVEEEPVEEVEEKEEEEVVEEEPEAEPAEEKEEAPTASYSLDEIPEYVELSKQYNTLVANYEALKQETETLRAFKNDIDRKDKEAMIKSFYMLSDEEKSDVVNNIDTYTLDEIEAKLSVICVRNKVSFDLDDENNNESSNTTIYTLGSEDDEDAGIPLWVKAVRDTAKTMND